MTHAPLAGVFTIPVGRSFLDDLAAGLAAAYPPETLARTRVYLPTRRACRDLTAAFLNLPGGAGLLPTAQPLGDADVDSLAFVAVEPALSTVEAALDLPPALPPTERTFELAKLAQAKHRAEYATDLPLAAAIRLAAALGRFLDELAIEEVDGAAIAEIDAGQFAAHWQKVLTFLEIVLTSWPAHLAVTDRLDPAARREALLKAQAAAWAGVPADAPVIVAGSTGAQPSTRALMRAVLASPSGAVVLPGFEPATEEGDAKAIRAAAGHPQHVMLHTMKGLDRQPADVAVWPASPVDAAAARRRLIREAMRPARTAGAWGDLPAGALADARSGLQRVDAPTEDMEARVIAVFLREQVEDNARVALVTPDRTLARRVAAELRRWDIEADDSGGRPLGETAVGAFLRLVARAFRPGAGAVDILALLKHPLAAGGMSRPRFRRRARALEIRVWRNDVLQRQVADLADAARLLAKDTPPLAAFADRVARLATPLTDLAASARTPLEALLAAHIETAEALAATDGDAGPERLWRGADGEAAAVLLAELLEAAPASPDLALEDYPDAFDALLDGAVVRPRPGNGAVAILGALEARLGRFDAVALGGLDEGVWPRPPAPDPWLSRAMRAEVGLSDPERRIGLSAHDFVQHLGAPAVLLTRSGRRDGAPTKPSRWLARLEAAFAAAGAEPLGRGDVTYLEWARRLDPDLPACEIPEPAFCPPVRARPRRLSVTRIKTLQTDPYAVYARYVLGLQALQPLDPPPSPADRGRIVHAAFEQFLRDWPERLPDDIAAELARAADTAFAGYMHDAAIAAFWRPAFDRAARWAAVEERARRAALAVAHVHVELKGGAEFPAPGGPFRLEARADRIDRLVSGNLAILDIKTGAEPPKVAMKDGREPQMPLEAAIALHGAFGDLAGRATTELAIWRVGGQGDGKVVDLDAAETETAAEDAWAGLQRLIAAFDDPDTPYLSEPGGLSGFSDYRALARRSDQVEERK